MISDEELLEIARKASKNAYCPYSNYPVGACAEFESGNIYVGCNVENKSYGITLCAERNALSTAAAEGEKTRLTKIAIYSPKSEFCFPCGACREWICEFSKGFDTEIILENENKECCKYNINKLLPYSFNLI